MGKLLAQAGLIAGRHVTWMPSYGAEVRGGTAYSMVKISGDEIASPVITRPDALIVMNDPSFLKYESLIKDGGIIIINKSLIAVSLLKNKTVQPLKIAATEMASRLGDTRCANMIAIGAFIKRSRTLSLKDVVTALKGIFKNKEDLFIMNKKALEAGHKLK